MSSKSTPSTRAATVLLAAVLLHAASVLLGCQGARGQDPTTAVEGPAVRSPLLDSSALHQIATESAFAVELSTTVMANEGDDTAKHVHGYTLSGTWHLYPIDVADQRWLLARLQLDRFALGYEPNGIWSKAEHEAHLRTHFQRAILLSVTPEGEIQQVRAPADLTAVALGGLKALASHFQLSASGPAAGRRWRATELDTVGEYNASYTRNSATELTREKSSYGRLAKQNALSPLGDTPPPVVRGEDRFTLDDQQRVLGLTSRETLQFAASPMLPKLSAETLISARRVNVSLDTLSASEADPLLTLPARAFFADPPEASRRLELDVAKVGDLRSVQDALSRFEALAEEAGPNAGAQARRLQLSLGALIRLSASAEEEAWSLLQSAPGQGAVLRSALTQTPRAESQRRLIHLLRDSTNIPLDEQSRLLMSLAENPAPSPELFDALIELRKTTTLRDTVLMAIGGVCHEAMVSAPALALLALQELEAELVGASETPAKLAITLRALGNSGHPRVWDLAAPFLVHPSEAVRSAAARALRRVEDPRVDVQLENMRTGDSSESVQKVALAIAEQRRQRELGRVR